jgi:catechol-2,3-dioxygenase
VIAELGHVGLWVDDLDRMCRFYSEVLGLAVTDRDDAIGMVFLSSRPEVEHHELVLARGRTGGHDDRIVNQVSWRLDDLDALLAFHARFLELDVPIRQTVTHGNALGIYFEDPEGNVNEVYWQTGRDTPQPYRKSIDLAAPRHDVLEAARRLLEEQAPAYERR